MSSRDLRGPRLTLAVLDLPLLRAELERDGGEVARRLHLGRPTTIFGEDDLSFVRAVARSLESDPQASIWGPRAILLGDAGQARTVVGNAGFHGPPTLVGGLHDEGDTEALSVEVGYAVEEAYRRRGYATEAVGLLVAFAASMGCAWVRAEIEPTNLASLGVVRAAGFVADGSDSAVYVRRCDPLEGQSSGSSRVR